ncbi:hypothetical protein [Nostoc sp. FACHB-888]|uniref:hypothetical protein n=1 Tax=Nostoc sp. FACHB-888 TaxID=2692842 RepID=UPI0016842162|nr:hypothetical protein [Nostoc sp. FACHB-888]MBD2245122.1 hypothetical protein [Nostoc sp. FACHB-888]
MSDQNRVNVRLTATDLISPAIARIRENMGVMGAQVGSMGSNGGIFSTMMGGLGASAIMGTLGAVSSAISGISNSIQDAAKIQTLGLAEAGDLAGRLGVNFGKAKDLVAETRAEIVKMAAALPGENGDFNTIASSISATVAGISGGDEKTYKERLLGLTEGYGVLGAIRGANMNMGGMALNKALSGSSTLSEVFRIELFARNPVLKEELLSEFAKQGMGQDWKQLTTETRFNIMDAARKKAITKETLDSFDGTVDSMIQIMKTNIFNQDVGIFGFLKKIPEMGNRTGLDAVQGLMMSLGSFGQSLTPFMNSIGLNSDSFMTGFIKVTDWFSDLTGVFTGLNYGESLDSLDSVFSNMVGGLTGITNGFLKGLERTISKTDWLQVGAGLSKLGVSIWKGIYQIDWGSVASILFKALVIAPVQIIAGGIANTASEIAQMIKGAFVFIFEKIRDIGASLNPIAGIRNFADQGIKNTQAFVGSGIDRLFGSKEAKQAPSASIKPSDAILDIGKPVRGLSDSIRPLEQPGTAKETISTPLVIPKTENSTKSVSFNPSFTINAPEGTNTDGLVALIRNTINEDWRNYRANSLA